MPSETNYAKERQNVRNARSRALRALETPEEKLVKREREEMKKTGQGGGELETETGSKVNNLSF